VTHVYMKSPCSSNLEWKLFFWSIWWLEVLVYCLWTPFYETIGPKSLSSINQGHCKFPNFSIIGTTIWFYFIFTMSKVEFHKLFGVMLEHNLFIYLYYGGSIYIYMKKYMYRETPIYFKSHWNDFLVFMKFVIFTLYVIILNSLNHICEPFEEFHNFQIINWDSFGVLMTTIVIHVCTHGFLLCIKINFLSNNIRWH
jgi:hypothetical protein